MRQNDCIISIMNEDCKTTMQRMIDNDEKVHVILTSPFYNTNKKSGKTRTLDNTVIKSDGFPHIRYDCHVDNMSDDQYTKYTEDLFGLFDKILIGDGVVLYNLSYGNENTEGMFKAVNGIICNTNFTIADVLCWKKKSAMPNNCSKNRLTRIWEFVFVFCRKNEKSTFHCNKKICSYRKTGQPSYENIFNFFEARNNDGTCKYNRATFSSEFCEHLLDLYAPKETGAIVYDPFIGTGTTAVACKRMGISCIGSEISENQHLFAVNRINETHGRNEVRS